MSTAIPQPPGVPLLGNIFDVDPKNTWWSLKTLAEKYGESSRHLEPGDSDHEHERLTTASIIFPARR